MAETSEFRLRLIDWLASGREVDWEDLVDEADRLGESDFVEAMRLLSRVRASGQADDADGTPFREWGPFTIQGRLGGGSYGEVYRAWDPIVRRAVALKIYHQDPRDSAEHRTRQLEEARVLGQISHPNVAIVHGANIHDGRVGFWMELIEGESLDQQFIPGDPIPEAELRWIARQLASALRAIHECGVVHGDVKAANVIRRDDRSLVLVDFGTASTGVQAAAAELRGTPLYAGPELFTGMAPSPRTDLYALGVLLYLLATGDYPVPGTTVDEVRTAHTTSRRRPVSALAPHLSRPFAQLIDRLTEPESSQRLGTASELLHALDETEPRARSRRILGLGALAVVATIMAGWFWSRAPGPGFGGSHRVVFLGLEATTPADSADVFAISELLKTSLERIPQLTMMSESALGAYELDPRQAGLLFYGPASSEDPLLVLDGTARKTSDGFEIAWAANAWPDRDPVGHDASTGGDILSTADQTSRQIAQLLAINPDHVPTSSTTLTSSTRAWKAYVTAQTLWQTTGKRDEPIDSLRVATALDSSFCQAYVLLARLDTEDSDRTLGLFEHSWSMRQRLSLRERLLLEADLAVWRESDWDDANRIYEEVATRWPDHEESVRRVWGVHMRRRQAQLAVADMERLSLLNPGALEYQSWSAWLAHWSGRHTDAISIATRLCETHPSDARSWSLAGALHQVHGRTVQAQLALEQAVALDDSAEYRAQLALCGYVEGPLNRVIRDFQLVYPDPGSGDTSPSLTLGELLSAAGRTREAIAIPEQVVRSTANHGRAVVHLGYAAYWTLQGGHPEDALAFLDRADQLARESGMQKTYADRNDNLRALTLSSMGRHDEAMALARGDTRFQVEAELAIARGDSDRALAMTESLSAHVGADREWSRLQWSSEEFIVLKSTVLRMTGQADVAREFLDKSLAVARARPRVLAERARVALALSDSVAARAFFDEALAQWARADDDYAPRQSSRDLRAGIGSD